jgi:hypothetical protein
MDQKSETSPKGKEMKAIINRNSQIRDIKTIFPIPFLYQFPIKGTRRPLISKWRPKNAAFTSRESHLRGIPPRSPPPPPPSAACTSSFKQI